MNSTTGSAGSNAKFIKPYEPSDGRHRAFFIFLEMLGQAQSVGLLEYVKLEVETVLYVQPNAAEAGANAATRGQYEIDLKRYQDQQMAIGKLYTKLRELVSDEAWNDMLQFTSSSIFALLSPRQIVRKFKEAFCKLSGPELITVQLILQKEWVKGTSLKDFVSAHATAREQLEVVGETTPSAVQVDVLELALRNLFAIGWHFGAKAAMRTQFAPYANNNDAFNSYVTILHSRIREGQFGDVTVPIAQVNSVKEQSAGGARSRGPLLSPAEKIARNAANKKRFASISLDADCPVHTNRNKEGKLHKWRDCHVYTGKEFESGGK